MDRQEMARFFRDAGKEYPHWHVWITASDEGLITTVSRQDSPGREYYQSPIPWRFLDEYLLFIQDAIQTMTEDLPEAQK